MTKTFFILWFMISSNTHTLNVVKFDTEAECRAALYAITTSFNEDGWLGGVNYSKCIRVDVDEN